MVSKLAVVSAVMLEWKCWRERIHHLLFFHSYPPANEQSKAIITMLMMSITISADNQHLAYSFLVCWRWLLRQYEYLITGEELCVFGRISIDIAHLVCQVLLSTSSGKLQHREWHGRQLIFCAAAAAVDAAVDAAEPEHGHRSHLAFTALSNG